ncbi:hypothetical protein Mal35_42020 [Gimesia maris]|nr:hypothetical protein Mal35_42020 [Gimesia maris]
MLFKKSFEIGIDRFKMTFYSPRTIGVHADIENIKQTIPDNITPQNDRYQSLFQPSIIHWCPLSDFIHSVERSNAKGTDAVASIFFEATKMECPLRRVCQA